jgi:hypothetical protein
VQRICARGFAERVRPGAPHPVARIVAEQPAGVCEQRFGLRRRTGQLEHVGALRALP